ncbi:hypothetical protein CEXT_649871 [Caerostris extrusa]|uniref:LAGLIDADG homing endonuclease n=1 Tax=Caerostris extrusa TaxID=172846 RepID=A0AAV4VPI6_CAEEX|nr:hypothetical protein CEXT_649871 [Caerostris extrusa]
MSSPLFLKIIKEIGVPDCDSTDHKSFNNKIKYRLELQKILGKDSDLVFRNLLERLMNYVRSESRPYGTREMISSKTNESRDAIYR